MNTNAQQLTEQEMLTDALTAEKDLLHNYGIFLPECTCQNLRNELTQIITETQQVQFEIYNAMKAKGWYCVKQAPMQDVSQTVQKFQQIKSSL